MSIIFGNAGSIPGCFTKQKRSSGTTGAMFSMVGSSKYSIVSRFNFKQSDDYTPVKCLGDVAYINLFGKSAVAEADVFLQLFLIRGTDHTGIIDTIKGMFKNKRLSKGNSEPCKLTIGSRVVVSGYPVSLELSASSDQTGLAEAVCHVVSLEDR